MQTSGNTILITGGTSGIGLAFAQKFLGLGNTVVICGRREDRLSQIKAQHPALVTKLCDIAITDQRRELFTWTTRHYPQINVLINNAGIQLVTDLTKEVDLNRVRAEVETNLIAPVHLASLFALHLSNKPAAAIINISSGLAFAPLAFMPVYCATKAAVHSLSLSLRHQLKNTQIQVFEIVPPSVDTELGHDRREDKSHSHGGIPVADFITEAMEAIEHDVLEAAIGQAKGLKAKREELFNVMNK